MPVPGEKGPQIQSAKEENADERELGADLWGVGPVTALSRREDDNNNYRKHNYYYDRKQAEVILGMVKSHGSDSHL